MNTFPVTPPHATPPPDTPPYATPPYAPPPLTLEPPVIQYVPPYVGPRQAYFPQPEQDEEPGQPGPSSLLPALNSGGPPRYIQEQYNLSPIYQVLEQPGPAHQQQPERGYQTPPHHAQEPPGQVYQPPPHHVQPQPGQAYQQSAHHFQQQQQAYQTPPYHFQQPGQVYQHPHHFQHQQEQGFQPPPQYVQQPEQGFQHHPHHLQQPEQPFHNLPPHFQQQHGQGYQEHSQSFQGRSQGANQPPPTPPPTRHRPIFPAPSNDSDMDHGQDTPASTPEPDLQIFSVPEIHQNHPGFPAELAFYDLVHTGKVDGMPDAFRAVSKSNFFGHSHVQHKLKFRQQPRAIRVSTDNDKRMIDPPVIIQLSIEGPLDIVYKLSQHMSGEHYVMQCRVVSSSGEEYGPPQDQPAQYFVPLPSRPFVGKDEFGELGCFFVFHGLYFKKMGEYRLRFTLWGLGLPDARICKDVPTLAQVTSNIFTVCKGAGHDRARSGTRSNAALVRCLRAQGCDIPIIGRRRKGSKDGETHDNTGQEHEKKGKKAD